MLHDLLQYTTALPKKCSTDDSLCAVHRGRAPADLHTLVEGFLSKMDAAAEADMEANKQQRPAVAKLGLIPEMQRIFTNKKVHLPSSALQETQTRNTNPSHQASHACLEQVLAMQNPTRVWYGSWRCIPHLSAVPEQGLNQNQLTQPDRGACLAGTCGLH